MDKANFANFITCRPLIINCKKLGDDLPANIIVDKEIEVSDMMEKHIIRDLTLRQ